MNATPMPEDIATWRRSERRRLRAERLELSVTEREAAAASIAGVLNEIVAGHFADPAGHVISGYWPIKAELDLRFWLGDLHDRGARLALPVVAQQGQPLVFRHWQPGAPMERGFWNIPVPTAEAEPVTPELALAPLVGWDAAGYRLGYGGGYFDRTLAALHPRPLVIGVGLQGSLLDSIRPQPHDIALDAIVTETGLQWQSPRLSPHAV